MLSIVPCGYVKVTARGKEKAATEVTAYVSYIQLSANCQESIIDCIGVSTLRHELLSAAHQCVKDHSVLIRAHRNLELFLSLEHLAYLRSCSPLRLYYTSFQLICKMCDSDVGFVLNGNGAGCLSDVVRSRIVPILDHISCNRSTTRGEAINFGYIHRPCRTVFKE